MGDHIQERKWTGSEENQGSGKPLASKPEKNSPVVIWGGALAILAILGVSHLLS